MLKNVSASVFQRLRNHAQATGDELNHLLRQYAIERLLYRLSLSRFAARFTLKGAQLFTIWSATPHRTTRDLDLLGEGEPAVAEMVDVFREVATLPVDPPDGIDFHTDAISGEAIREEAHYIGVRLFFVFQIGQAKGRLHVDIGFGDIVIPAPEIVRFPVLLDFPAPLLKAYSRETVVAEKFEAMIVLGEQNSRMKDFYDLYVLAQRFSFDGEILAEAMAATFRRRRTLVPEGVPMALTAEFATYPEKITQWRAFLRKNRFSPEPAFTEVIALLHAFLLPPMQAVAREEAYRATWAAQMGWSCRTSK